MFYLPCWNWSFYCSLKISPSKQIFKDYIHEKAKPKTKTKKIRNHDLAKILRKLMIFSSILISNHDFFKGLFLVKSTL